MQVLPSIKPVIGKVYFYYACFRNTSNNTVTVDLRYARMGLYMFSGNFLSRREFPHLPISTRTVPLCEKLLTTKAEYYLDRNYYRASLSLFVGNLVILTFEATKTCLVSF